MSNIVAPSRLPNGSQPGLYRAREVVRLAKVYMVKNSSTEAWVQVKSQLERISGYFAATA